jgi:hypothetical protein
MPITPPGLTATITGGLLSAGMLGIAVPQLAAGIANGVSIWLPTVTVMTVDAGVLGAGVGVLPFVVPLPLVLSSLMTAYAANGQLGVMAPLEASGLANGLVLGFLQGLIVTTHPGVGVGVGVARLLGPPAFPSLMQGFASAGITGQGAVLKANAISMAFDMIFAVYVTPIPIVGSVSPFPAGGAGFGNIL